MKGLWFELGLYIFAALNGGGVGLSLLFSRSESWRDLILILLMFAICAFNLCCALGAAMKIWREENDR